MIYEIRAAKQQELLSLQEVEREAGQIFATVGLPEVAAGEPLTVNVLNRACNKNHLWVTSMPK